MKPRNPVLTTIVAFIIPFYTYYWWYDSTKRLQAKAIEKVPSITPVFTVFLIYTALIIGTALHMDAGKSSETSPPGSYYGALALIPLLYLLTIVFAYRFVKAANQIVEVTIKPGLMTAIFFLLPPAGIYIYQKQFNGLVKPDAEV